MYTFHSEAQLAKATINNFAESATTYCTVGKKLILTEVWWVRWSLLSLTWSTLNKHFVMHILLSHAKPVSESVYSLQGENTWCKSKHTQQKGNNICQYRVPMFPCLLSSKRQLLGSWCHTPEIQPQFMSWSLVQPVVQCDNCSGNVCQASSLTAGPVRAMQFLVASFNGRCPWAPADSMT